VTGATVTVEKPVVTKEKKKKSRKDKKRKKVVDVAEEVEEVEEKEPLAKEPVDETPAIDMTQWGEFNLEPRLIHGLRDLGFTAPTEIQKRTLPVILPMDRDLLGAGIPSLY
jgi:hypothetical protein